MTSANGTSWTTHTSPTNDWFSVVWSPDLNLFVAVAYDSAGVTQTTDVMTSPDGTNWTARTAAAAIGWGAVTWSPSLSLFVAVAETGTGNEVMTSPDGTTWTSQTTATYFFLPVGSWYDIIWAATAPNGLGGEGLFAATSISGYVMTSPDGVNWTLQTGFPSSIEARGIAWSPELGLFAVDVEVYGQVLTSPDGVTWTARTPGSMTSDNWYSMTWADTAPNGLGGSGLFVAMASTTNSNDLMTSPDGINWTERDTGVLGSSGAWHAVDWSPSLNLFVAVGNGVVISSPDGVTWTSRTSPASNPWFSVVWAASAPNDSGGSGLFVAVSYDSAGTAQSSDVMTSPDGINWTARTAAGALKWERVAWSPVLGVFVAVANGDVSNDLMTSPDGVTWTIGAMPSQNDWNGIAWSDQLNMFAAVASGPSEGPEIITSSLQAPIISSVATVTTTQTSATITWTTDEEASSKVNYGADSSYGSSSSLDASLVFSHSVTLSGLACDATYHFQVVSALGGLSSSSGDHTFTTTLGSCSSNATLSNLTLGSGTLSPSFIGSTTSYTASVANAVTSTTVTPTAYVPAAATLTVNGTPATSGSPSGSVSLSVGSNTITIVVTAQDGMTTDTYTVTVTRAAAPSGGGDSGGGGTTRTNSAGTVVPVNLSLIHVVVTNNGSGNITLNLTAGPEVAGLALGNRPDLSDSSGIRAMTPSVQWNVCRNVATCAATVYVEFYSSTGASSGILAYSVPAPGMSSSAFVFTRALKQGSHGQDVKALQQFLNAHGYTISSNGPGSPGNETTYFGSATKAALSKYQTANGISPAVGYFGPVTMGVVNAMD